MREKVGWSRSSDFSIAMTSFNHVIILKKKKKKKKDRENRSMHLFVHRSAYVEFPIFVCFFATKILRFFNIFIAIFAFLYFIAIFSLILISNTLYIWLVSYGNMHEFGVWQIFLDQHESILFGRFISWLYFAISCACVRVCVCISGNEYNREEERTCWRKIWIYHVMVNMVNYDTAIIAI